jgi:hypothetical protein
MTLVGIGGRHPGSITLDTIVKTTQRGRLETSPAVANVVCDESIDPEALLMRLSGAKGFFTHIKILVELGIFSNALVAILGTVCQGTRTSRVYARILTYAGYDVPRAVTSTSGAWPEIQLGPKIPVKIAAALDRLDLCDTFAAHGNELISTDPSLRDIQHQIEDVTTRADLLSLRTSPVLRGEFIQHTRSLLQTIAARPMTGDAAEKITDLYGHCEALLIIATSLDTGGIYVNREMQPLGSGAFNSTFLFAAEDGTAEVFKPLPVEKNLEARRKDNLWNSKFGIDPHNAANRNLAACAVAELIGHPELVVGTRLAVVNGQVGLAMARAGGISVFDAAREQGLDLRNDPDFQRQCTWLQLLDCIIGNMDRHSGNLNWEEKLKKLTSYDNDMTLIAGISRSLANTLPGQLYYSRSGTTADDSSRTTGSIDGKSPRNYCVPAAIDAEMQGTILALSEESLRDTLRAVPLKPDQISAACCRLRCLKEQIQDPAKVTVIRPGEWGSGIPSKCRHYNTYFMSYTRTLVEQDDHPPPPPPPP